MSRTPTFKEFHQRRLDDCPRVAGDEPLRAEAQRLIDELPAVPEPGPGLEDWTRQVCEGMVRMATDEAERLKVARRLF